MLLNAGRIMGKSQNTLKLAVEKNGKLGGSSLYKQLGGEEPDELT